MQHLLPATAVDIYENEAGVLSEHPEDTYFKIAWKTGQRDDEMIRQVLEFTFATAVKLGWNKLLVDQSAMQVSSGQVEGWFLQQWLTRSANHYTQAYCAIVTPRNLEARLSTVALLRVAYEQYANLPICLFQTEEKAVEWLRESPRLPLDSLWPSFVH